MAVHTRCPLCVNEISLAAGGQDPDAKTAEFRVADFADGLSGLEGIDKTLGQAAIGHGFSPESVAQANRKTGDWPFPVLYEREKRTLIQIVTIS